MGRQAKIGKSRRAKRTAVGEEQVMRHVSAKLRQAAKLFDEEGFNAVDHIVNEDAMTEKRDEMQREGLEVRKQWRSVYEGDDARIPIMSFMRVRDCHSAIEEYCLC
jgi:hypothetical protein